MEGEMVMREVTPKELQKLNAKSWKETQKIFRRRLREIAAGGENKAKYNENDYCAGDYIAGWLRNLGFTVKRVGLSGWHEITWPEEEDLIERLRSESIKILTQPMPAKVHYAIGWLNTEYGTWSKDMAQYDYVCSKCGKHSMYKTDFCCNCGKKMKNDKE
jgi:hypothetical protein